jgi:FKBP-type peptidyl-prolyl cis-trans isomerase FklB
MALKLMRVGSKWEIYIPWHLVNIDERADKDVPPGSTVIFDLELLGIKK